MHHFVKLYTERYLVEEFSCIFIDYVCILKQIWHKNNSTVPSDTQLYSVHWIPTSMVSSEVGGGFPYRRGLENMTRYWPPGGFIVDISSCPSSEFFLF